MSYRCCEFDVTHTFTTNFCTSYFNAATFADNSFETYALVLTAITFPVTSWSEDFFIEETIFFWLECAVVDGLWLLNFTKGPLTNILRRSETDS